MKKTLSLFISLILILSMMPLSLSSVAFAADGEVKLAKELIEASGAGLTATSNKIGTSISLFGNEDMGGGVYNVRADSNIFGENVIVVNHRPSYTGTGINNDDTRMQMNPGDISTGTVKVTFKLYLAAQSDGNLAIRMRKGTSGYAVTQSIMDLGLDPYKWYNIETVVDLDTTSDNCYLAAYNTDGSLYKKISFTCDFSGSFLRLFLIWGTPLTNTLPSGAPASMQSLKAFYAMKDYSYVHITGETKAKILSVASSGEAAYDQNNLSFKLSKPIAGLTKDHVTVKSTSGEIKASQLTALSSGEVNVMLERNLAPWTDYTLEIDASAYAGYKEVTSDGISAVSAIKADFHTATAPFDMKDPVFTYDGSSLKASTQVINTSGTPKDLYFVFTRYTSDGQYISRAIRSYPDFVEEYPGRDVELSVAAEDGNILTLFVMDSFDSKRALFGKSWTVTHNGTNIPYVSSSGENAVPSTIAIGDFDYENKEIRVDLKCATEAATEGVLSVYSPQHGYAYIDYALTHMNGTFAKVIKFADSFAYGTYTVEFTPSVGSDAITGEFTYYSPDELLDNKRQNILDDAKSAPTAGALMSVILGTDENEVKVNDNFEIFSADAADAYYSKLKNKAEVFALMKKGISGVGTYNELVNLFKSASYQRYNAENRPSSSPSSNNKNYGGTSNVVTETMPKEEAPAPGTGNSQTTVFSDMNGHWAEKFAASLSQKGIIGGYEDGTFRGDNYITRAELAKILSETFGSELESTKEFADVSAGSWYAPFVKKAAANGIVTGFEDGSFRPDSYVTKEDAIVMLYRALSLNEDLPQGYTLFADDLDISSYAQPATRCLGEIGIVTGTPTKEFLPKSNITRAEVAAIICRSLDYTQAH